MSKGGFVQRPIPLAFTLETSQISKLVRQNDIIHNIPRSRAPRPARVYMGI